MNDLTMAEIRELQELIEASELYGLTDKENTRLLELKQRISHDDFDDFLCATLFY